MKSCTCDHISCISAHQPEANRRGVDTIVATERKICNNTHAIKEIKQESSKSSFPDTCRKQFHFVILTMKCLFTKMQAFVHKHLI